MSRPLATTAGAVKALYDSCYIRPEENPKVIQDNDPVKTNALEVAKKRYEDSVNKTKEANEHFVKTHFDSI